MKLTVSIITLLLASSMAFSQAPEDVNYIKKVCYTNMIKGDWLVHRIHDTEYYEVYLNSKLLKDKKKRNKASNEAYLAFVKMRKALLKNRIKPPSML